MTAILQGPFGSISLNVPRLTIGRALDNQLVLSDGSVTAHHAEVRPEGHGYYIIDLGSSAGTFVNEQQIYPNIPQALQSGDRVRIGNVRLTYDTSGGEVLPPTVLATPSQQPGSEYPPTTAPYQPSSPTPAPYPPSSFTPPPPSSFTPPPTPPPVQQRSRRGLWIMLSVIGVLLVIGVVLFVLGTRGPSTTPTQTFQKYCTAYKTHDGQTIYDLYTDNARRQLGLNSVSDAQRFSEPVTDCTASNINDSATTSTISLTYQHIGKLSFDATLVNDNNTWKIDSQKTISTPTRTLYEYCVAVLKGDYQAAYNLYTPNGQSPYGSEQKYANSYAEKPSDCSLSNVDDAQGTGSVTMKFSSGSQSFDETLTKQNDTWKIEKEQAHSTPTLTLTTYCTALKQANYQTAYNQISREAQAQESETQFASNFSTIQVTDCSVSNVDDTAGTGTITYAVSDGRTVVADYTLVQEDGVWKIKTEKARQ